MSWDTRPNTQPIRQAESMIEHAFVHYRNRGQRRCHALEMVAAAFRLTTRRVRSFLEQEPVALSPDEYRQITARYLEHLDNEVADLTRRTEMARERKRQFERTMPGDGTASLVLEVAMESPACPDQPLRNASDHASGQGSIAEVEKSEGD